MNLIFFGFPRSGKTYYAKMLANQLNRPFIDTDQLIETSFANGIYRNNLKNREFGKEDPQNSHAERETIAHGQGSSEHVKFAINPMLPKTDSSGCFGISCYEIYHLLGNDAFRMLETEVLQTLSLQKNSIIAVGGGMVLNPLNTQILQSLGQLIYLKISKELLKQRLLTCQIPAFFDADDLDGSFENMYTERKEIYEHIQSIHLTLDGKSDAEILEEILCGK